MPSFILDIIGSVVRVLLVVFAKGPSGSSKATPNFCPKIKLMSFHWGEVGVGVLPLFKIVAHKGAAKLISYVVELDIAAIGYGSFKLPDKPLLRKSLRSYE
jgi:hypothetical protein